MALFVCIVILSAAIAFLVVLEEPGVGIAVFVISFLITGLLASVGSLIVADNSGNTYIHEKTEIMSDVEFNDGYFYYQSDEGLTNVDKVSAAATELVEGEGLFVVRRRGIESPWLFNWTDRNEYVLHVEEVEWK